MNVEDGVVHQQGTITEFQGDAIAQGHSGPFMFGSYRVYEHVAAGRLGGMYRAVHEEFDQPVSLKIFPSSLADDPTKVARIALENAASVADFLSGGAEFFPAGLLGGLDETAVRCEILHGWKAVNGVDFEVLGSGLVLM